jgi:hypothetical protein
MRRPAWESAQASRFLLDYEISFWYSVFHRMFGARYWQARG